MESRGVLRTNGCREWVTEERVLSMMDDIVQKQGERRRKDRMRRMNQWRLERERGSGPTTSASMNAGNEQQQQSSSPPKRSSAKRDSSGHLIKESAVEN